MGVTDVVDSKACVGASGASAQPPRLTTIAVPPRPASFEAFFGGGSIPGFSPGPMTLLSSLFSPDSNSCSFSQLLAGAMASPVAKSTFLLTDNLNNYNNNNNSSSSSSSSSNSTEINPAKELTSADATGKGSGYKQNRPMGLMVAHSPLFLVPSGLSPSGLLNSPSFLSPLQSPFGMSHQQALAHVTAQAAFSQSFKQMQADYQHSSSTLTSAETPELQPSPVSVEALQQNLPSQPQCLKMRASEAPQSEKKPGSIPLDKPTDDGYNWRKYGQKLVKTKEHPRSYYKCTYLNCPVKKKVERAPDGHIAEITYKGQHNHELPQHNVRAKDSSNAAMNSREMSGSKNQIEMDVLSEVDTFNSNSRKNKLPNKSMTEQVPVDAEHDEMEDSAIVIDEENDDDEPIAKRSACVSAPSLKTITEPKIVVQTRSEVDLLDDGYKWRKYGQKVVKGNPHPRSYYRCTYAGCNVRKHVERASNDPKAVITTYEGKHNHDIPTARNNKNQSVVRTMQLKPQKMSAAKKASVLRGRRDFENKEDKIQVF